ncbi:MAG: LysR family transcriptional regulator [Lachnospiraceae bacterium]|nr:LysR family transcriptional regulator [Lachnospiraceae bacterium]
MTLQQLYYFQMIARLQHYNKAAKELHVAQPSLSKSMALLEEELQVSLFEKQGRNIILTKYGKVFQGYVDTILNEIERAKSDMQSMLDPSSGHINIAYISPFAHNYIPKLVRKFLEREENSNVTFSFKEGFTSSMIKSIHDNETDVVFGSYEENEPDLTFFPIIRENLILIAPIQMEIAEDVLHSLHDFQGTPFISYDHTSNMGKFTRKLFREENLSMNFVCESSNELSILSLVENNFGIAYVAETKEVKSAIENGRVKQIMVEENRYRYLYMIYKSDKFHSPAVWDFIEFIKAAYAVII